MSIIEDLKNNCKPFGLMTAPMQEKAGQIGVEEFWVYCEFGQTEMDSPPVWGKHPPRFSWGETFKLRPDYEEPKIKLLGVDRELIKATIKLFENVLDNSKI